MSDTHAGHRLGLCNPNTLLQQENQRGELEYKPVELSEVQKYLWELFENGLQEVKNLAGKDEIIFFHLGDVTQGNKYASEWISTRISDQLMIGEMNLTLIIELPTVKTARLVMGTPSHSLYEGSSDITVAKLLSNKFPKKNIRTFYHGLADIDGFTVDFAHHGPPTGSRTWLRGNEARYYLRNIMLSEIQNGNVPPQLFLRGHYHSYIKEYLCIDDAGTERESWMVVMPSMCMLGDYGRMATRSAFNITNGMIAVEIINGHFYKAHFFGKTMDIRTKEKI